MQTFNFTTEVLHEPGDLFALMDLVVISVYSEVASRKFP